MITIVVSIAVSSLLSAFATLGAFILYMKHLDKQLVADIHRTLDKQVSEAENAMLKRSVTMVVDPGKVGVSH